MNRTARESWRKFVVLQEALNHLNAPFTEKYVQESDFLSNE